MNLPQIFSRFHLRKLERRPLSLRAGSFVLRGLEIHASTLKSQTDLVDLFLYAWHIYVSPTNGRQLIATGHDFAQLFVMRSTKERSDWCQHGGAPAPRGGTMRSGTATYYESCVMAMDAGGVTARPL
ncbi:hypothetical protein N9C66_00140 [Akkermansiaceae bacterium]|nr:hypothetical protein [Akkermansiaceae bacterium]